MNVVLPVHDAPAAAAPVARIGPNAVIQLVPAAQAQLGRAGAAALFAAAGVPSWLDHPPEEMTDERPVAALHQALRRLHPAEAPGIAAAAGRLTGLYILANRIPGPAKAILKVLPAPLAARALSGAIARHAWTFAGSGAFRVVPGRPVVATIADNPVVRGERADEPICAWHAAVFTTLFAALVHPRAVARETACCAAGASACRFEIDWR